MKVVKPAEFVEAFSDRLNKSKDENSDFPLFVEFLSNLFLSMYEASAGEVKYANLKIAYKQEYDSMDKEDVVFIYKQFFEETIVLLKKKVVI